MDKFVIHTIFLIYSIIIYKYRHKIAIYFGILDMPDANRKSHHTPVPAIGGIIIFPFITYSLITLYSEDYIKLKILFIWILLYLSFFLIGLVDDRIHLNAKIKTFFLLFVLFIILPLDKSLIIENLQFKDLDYVILLNQGSLFFTIFCIFFFYNSFNFSDGLNGISILISIYFLSILIFSKNEINSFDIAIIFSLVLILIPNLMGKIFIGNSGVSFLACVIFIYIIDSYNKSQILFDEIILILFLPTIDTVRITIERLLSGKSPFLSDKNHFHHLLTKIINKKYVCIPYILFSILPYLTNNMGIVSYLSFTIFLILYSFILIFLKLRND